MLLAEIVTGRRPFSGRTPFELTSAILRCLAKTPAARYARASDVRGALEECARTGSEGRRSATVSGERRQITALSCEIVHASGSEARDPEELHAGLPAFESACADVLARLGGRLATTTASQFTAYFGFPQAHEDDACHAVKAGLELIAALAAPGAVPRPARSVRQRFVRAPHQARLPEK